ncbi:MAG: hypothetical protein IKZ25_00770 [Clostridia bacterium]|nr:hypothetical protein [Clostridia bacterium]
MDIKILSQFYSSFEAENAARKLNKLFVLKSVRILFSKLTKKKPIIYYKENGYSIPEKGSDAFAFNGVYEKFYSAIDKKDFRLLDYKIGTNPDFEMIADNSCVLEICADYSKIHNITKAIRNSGGYNITFSGLS